MKKLIALLLVLVSLFLLCSCGGKKPDTSSANKITYGEKYIYKEHVARAETQQSYIIFEDGLMKWHQYSFYNGEIDNRIISYKYEILDEGMLAYFFHSEQILEGKDKVRKTALSSGTMVFSENVLRPVETTTADFYIRESYVENELPNFAPERDLTFSLD